MNELAILYDKVCAAYPAAIARTKWGELVCQWNGETLTNGADDIEHRKVRFWCWANGMSRHWRSEEEAEAMILKHWLGMLPHSTPNGDGEVWSRCEVVPRASGWTIDHSTPEWSRDYYGDTLVEALGEFLLAHAG